MMFNHWTYLMKVQNYIEDFLILIDEEIKAKLEELPPSVKTIGSRTEASKSATSGTQSATSGAQSATSKAKSATSGGQSITSGTHSSVLGTHSALTSSKEGENKEKSQLSLLENVKYTMENLKEVIGKFFFGSKDLEKDRNKILEIFENIREAILQHGLCKLYVRTQTELLKKEHVDMLNEDAADFVRRVTDVRLENVRLLRELAPLQEEYNSLETNRRNLELDSRKNDADWERKIVREGERRVQKLKKILDLQKNVVMRYDTELKRKKAEVERQKMYLQNLWASGCETWPNLPKLLRTLKFDNLNLIFEYFCYRNEFVATSNRLPSNKKDPDYVQQSFQGLFTSDAEKEPVVKIPEYGDEPFEEGADENGSMFSRISLYSQPSFRGVPWTSADKTTSYYRVSSDAKQILSQKLLPTSKDLSSKSSIADSLNEQEEEIEYETGSENSQISQPESKTQMIPLQERHTKLSWFTAHRTSLTPFIEEELVNVQEKIAQRSIHMETLVRQQKVAFNRRENKTIAFQIERYVTRHEGNEAFLYSKKLKQMRSDIKYLKVDEMKSLANLKEQDDVKATMRRKRCNLKPLQKELAFVRKIEEEARKTIRQQKKDIIAVHRAVEQAQVNKQFLEIRTRQMLDQRAVKLKQKKRKEEELKDKIAKLKLTVETEWSGVNSSILEHQSKIDEVKRKVQDKRCAIREWELKTAALYALREQEHGRIAAAKQNTLLLSKRLEEINRTNRLRKDTKFAGNARKNAKY